MQMDVGHYETELLLKETERDIRRVYAQAQAEAKRKLNDYLDKFKTKDAIKQNLLKQGKITKEEYAYWRKGQICIGKRWQEMVDTLAQDYTNADKIAMSIVKGHLPLAYALNHNYGTFQVEKGSLIDTSYTLYDRHTVERLIRDNPYLLPNPRVNIPKDLRWNRTHLNSAITQGILQGESLDKIANRLQSVTDMDHAAALRNARTMMTGAQNAGRVDSYLRAEAMGIDMEQEWLATLDGRTRHSHRMMDGERVAVGSEFPNGCRYPGDPDGPPEEVYNCRCTLVPAVKGVDQSNAPRNSKLGDMSYDEWKHEHEHVPTWKNTSIGNLQAPVRPKRSDFASEAEYKLAREKYKVEREKYFAEIDRAVSASLNQTAFSSSSELMQWAENNGIILSQDVIGSIDLRTFNEAKATIEEMLRRFPEIKTYSVEYFDGSIFMTDFRIGTTFEGLLSAGNGISFNPKWFGDAEYGIRSALEQITTGFNVRGDGSFATLIRHEYGHNVQSYIENRIAQKYHQHVDNWRLNFKSLEEYTAARTKYQNELQEFKDGIRALAGLKGSSEYSNTNINELFAEGFAEWSSGGNSEFAKAFGTFFKRWY